MVIIQLLIGLLSSHLSTPLPVKLIGKPCRNNNFINTETSSLVRDGGCDLEEECYHEVV